jgi:putative heme iron utilization protein
MNYKITEKRDRNKRLMEFAATHPDATIRAIAGRFHISAPRVHQILRANQSKK